MDCNHVLGRKTFKTPNILRRQTTHFLLVSALISTAVCNKQPTITHFRFRAQTAIMLPL